MRSGLIVVFVLVLAPGCYQRHGPSATLDATPGERDAGTRDAGPLDAGTEAGRLDAGGIDDASADASSRADAGCGCLDPPDECSSTRTLLEGFGRCLPDGTCEYRARAVDCPPGQVCWDGECRAGWACCDPGLCYPRGDPTLVCRPDPHPCIEDVAAIGCDGVTYGTECLALEARVCPNDCPLVPARAITSSRGCVPRSCGPPPGVGGPVVVYRDSDCWSSGAGACVPSPPSVDFDREQVIAACTSGCAGEHRLERVRDCDGVLVVDHYYVEPCIECDSDETLCIYVAVPRSDAPVLGNSWIDSGPICPP